MANLSVRDGKRNARSPPTENINPDIAEERENAKFDPIELTYVIDGGKEKTERRRFLESEALNDPVFDDPADIAFLTDEQRHTNSVRKSLHMVRRLQEMEITNHMESHWFRVAVHRSEEIALSLHASMFQHTVMHQMTEEQQAYWLRATKDYTLLGTYAQTELGHGTFLRGLETTATYDPTTQEFEIHSPTLTSMKWWPGNLGKTATHAIVAAQLYTKGSRMGVHMFMVPLRSLETHLPHPGVELGDIGPKLGYNNIDNGFLRFNHYRIPIENMCMRHSKVMPDGTYVPPPHKKISYGSMLPIRSGIVGNTGWYLSKGSTIATRYSVVRRQSELIPGTKEAKILDYQSQQLKIFPNLATAFAFIFTGREMMKHYFESLAEMDEGNYSSLPELHATSAGLKAFTSSVMASGLEELRTSCGGHGYSKASGFPELYGTAAPASTYEGENTVMFLQTARYLMKVARQAGSKDKLVGCAAYLQADLPPRCLAKRQIDFLRQDILVDAYKHRAKSVVMLAARRLGEELKKGHSQPIAWNNCHMYLVKAAMAHCHLYCVESFFDGVNTSETSQPALDALMTLCQFYAIFGISQNKGDLLQDGYMNGEQLNMLERQLIDLLAVIRPIAVTLVDAFDVPDKMLSSVLGRYDGNVYENLYEWAKSSPLNKKEVPDAYKYIGPFLRENIANSKL
ncbi:peroxisomal acyl-coenzyme A oxidase 1 isoform X3 [Strongylocentrotus purpuratus]|uniref:Acyl-coenzyme A oxidase n=1 Tax=Strongylocentrotus purpuratus TaxID=7668 RepID=A0A7M7GEK3_STRPU|nr:peroxisomal acyl-coenzyme A oxidase 1 isoform X3 [Strongylocentrotus purpuratus]|eukprot:XP_003724010.1 PREDICTED: peroxisomal acyl-coenzyme A oxidase 1 isoform X3 [Strongylocentrotus purpuratus]